MTTDASASTGPAPSTEPAPSTRLAPSTEPALSTGPASSTEIVLAVGDLTTDIVVRHPAAIARGTDNPSSVSVGRGGSAANVCAVSARLGRPARLLTVRGVDRSATERAAELEALGVEVVGPTSRRGPTIVVLVDSGGERTFLTDRGEAPGGGAWASMSIDRMMVGVDRVHLCGYWMFAEATRGVCRAVAAAAHDRGVPVSFDPSSVSLFDAVDPVAEARVLAPQLVLPNADEDRAVHGRWPGTVVTTNGSGPVVLRSRGIERAVPLRVDADDASTGDGSTAHRATARILDTTGAGDAFAAGFLATVDAHNGFDSIDDPVLDEAVRVGHRAALAVIGGEGADAWHPAAPAGAEGERLF